MSLYKVLLLDILSTAYSYGMKGYVVGGTIRDILLGVDNQKIGDLDIALHIQGQYVDSTVAYSTLHKFTLDIAQQYNTSYSVHAQYYTSSLRINIDSDYFNIDCALTRKECYPYPGGIPHIQLGEDRYYSIEEDLVRRDFTINAIALPLEQYIQYQDTQNRAMVEERSIALWSGKEDIKNRVVRSTHKGSFIEDPSRILRLFLYTARYSCVIEAETSKELILANNKKILSTLKKEQCLILVERSFLTTIEISFLFSLYIKYGFFFSLFLYSIDLVILYRDIRLYKRVRTYCSLKRSDESFIIYSILTQYSLAQRSYHRSSLVRYSIPKSILDSKKLFSVVQNSVVYRYTFMEHTEYIHYIQYKRRYIEYAKRANKLYYDFMQMILQAKSIPYAVAYFCSNISTRDILYIIMRVASRYKIILEEYLQFKYTKRGRILFDDKELGKYQQSIKPTLYMHVKASIFSEQLFTKEEQLACAYNILHRLHS